MKNIENSNTTSFNAKAKVSKNKPLENTQAQPIPALNITDLTNLKQSTLDLFRKSKRIIQIYSFSLDKRILNNRDIESSITQLIRSSRNAKIQCLIDDEKELQGIDHRIVSLAQRFTSFVEIRIIPNDYKKSLSGFYLIDKQFMIYRRNRDKHEAVQFNHRQIEVKDKLKHFEETWQQSRPASFLRALHI